MKTSKTSGQVGQKLAEIQEKKQKLQRKGDAYDYYLTDSDNDGLADVHDAEDLNPEIQNVSQQKNSSNHDRYKNQRTENKRIPKGKNNKESFKEKESKTNKKEPKSNNKGNEKNNPKTGKFKTEKPKKEASNKKTHLNFKEKKSKSKLSQNTGKTITTVAFGGQEVLRRHNQVQRFDDSEENSALQATEAGREVAIESTSRSSRALKHGLKSRNEKVTINRTKASHKSENQKLKLNKTLKDKKSYQKSSSLSKRYQKQMIKRSYNKKTYGSYTKKAEKTIKGIVNKVKQAIGVVAKKVGIYIVGIILAMFMLISTVSAFTGMLANGVSVILTTSYQSDDLEITATENVYNRLETDLEYAIENVESDHSGYDEYRYYIDVIDHDPQLLMAYLTAKYGEFTSSQVSRELSRIFDEHYDYSLTSVTETRHRTVTSISVDPITGATTSTSVRVSYDWDVLKVSLNTANLEVVLQERLDQEEEELFNTLMETKGNFPSLPSPIGEEWKYAISSMYGYRLDPFDGQIGFHTGIDIARPIGTELIAVFDGIITDTGYGSAYGNYIELTNEYGQSVFYAHCNSVIVNIGDDVLTGEKIGEMGSTGNSTGSHLHFEIKDSEGNRLNPYFYLSSD